MRFCGCHPGRKQPSPAVERFPITDLVSQVSSENLGQDAMLVANYGVERDGLLRQEFHDPIADLRHVVFGMKHQGRLFLLWHRDY